MKLSKNTVCAKIEIIEPRWKARTVGIATYRVKEHNEINILAMSPVSPFRRYYPDPLYGSGEMIRSCPTQKLSSGTVLYLVPISKLESLERTEL